MAEQNPEIKDDQVSYAQQLYSRLYSHPWVQQAMYGYDRTKHSCALMERTLGGVESRLQGAANRAQPVYEQYCQPRIEAVYNAYNRGVENTKYAVDVTKSAAVTTSTLGIGAAVVATQLALALGVAGANLLLDAVMTSKRVGQNMFTSAKDVEKSIEQRIIHFMQQAHGAAQVPLAMLNEQANIFLDVGNAVVDRTLGLQSEADPAGCTIGERVTRLGRRLSGVLTARARDDVIDPMYHQMQTVVDQLSKSLVLVDLIRERQVWAKEKVEEWHSSVNELKTRIENEAANLKQKPEEVLMRSLRHNSAQLTDKLNTLKEKGNQVLNETASAVLDSTVSYLGRLDQNLAEAEDIYKVRDEVLSEAQMKIAELAQWTSNLFTREHSQTPEDQNNQQ